MRTVLATAAAVLATAAALLAPQALAQPAAGGGEVAIDRAAKGAFALRGAQGKRVADADFRGRFMLVFFGYTSCPDVCPTHLYTIGEAMRLLGDAGQRVQPIFVTLDPERDSAEVLARYATRFHPRFLGLTGTPDEIAAAAENYGVVYVRVMKDGAVPAGGAAPRGASYTIDHSAYVYLVGPDGRFRAAFAHGTGAKALAAGVQEHLEQGGP
jgi:protein SCO1/2